MDPYYSGKVAVVTGAGGRLCSVIAEHLAEKGCRVVLIGRTREKLEKTASAIEAAGGTCMIRTADVCDETALKAVAEEVFETWGPCRFLINGAGGNNNKAITTNFYYDPLELSEDKPEGMVGFFDLDMDIFEGVIRTNTIGTVIPMRVFGRQMAKAKTGAVINFASMNSYRPLTRIPAYAIAKAGIVNFTEFLAVYFAGAGIRVNAIAPGFFINERSIKILGSPETGLTERGKNVMRQTPAGRFGNPEDLLGTVDWLLDDRLSSYVTGQTIAVDGGFQAHAGV
ncbi:MAG: SDR family oxidoreductase [Oscillospiraceae bacterium]|nr:SDR family oxidoreductase [Oscillospiraceae bacterium]